jgi:hypothetical protein
VAINQEVIDFAHFIPEFLEASIKAFSIEAYTESSFTLVVQVSVDINQVTALVTHCFAVGILFSAVSISAIVALISAIKASIQKSCQLFPQTLKFPSSSTFPFISKILKKIN